MPKPTFFRLPAARRDRLVHEAIVEFGNHAYVEASLSQMALRADIPKGSFYQYFEDKLDLYRWLLTEEVPRLKRAYLGETSTDDDFWERLTVVIERGIGFLVEHPHLARLSAAAADPSAIPEVRGLHRAICEAGHQELLALVQHGQAQGSVAPGMDAGFATRLIASVTGPGLTDVILTELGAELHEILASDALRQRLGPARRHALAVDAVCFLRGGLAPSPSAPRSSHASS